MKVLSLFDGFSCGQIALKELGIIPDRYYASEIDKFAIAQTKLNFPNTIHLGSVVDVDVSNLERIDLLIGGSPCQSFSFAGKRKGMATKCEIQITKLEQYLDLKNEGFQFEGQSYLFWEYMRILTDIRKYNPGVLFLLENVEMGSKWERILSEAIGIFGVHINSALVSAQNRKRIYWTNIRTKSVGMFGELYSDIPQPADRVILLRDILESDVDEKYFLSDKMLSYITKESEKPVNRTRLTNPNQDKCGSVLANEYKQGTDSNFIVHNLMPRSSTTGKGGTGPLSRNDVKTYCLDTGNTNAVEITPRQQANLRSGDEKANSFLSTSWKGSQANGMTLVNQTRIRRLTPTECARLQTVPSWYRWECSDTQVYKMCGNGWTIEVIKWIFSFLPNTF